MSEDDLARRLTGVETALAHLTEAVEELTEAVGPSAVTGGLIECHLRAAKNAFNRLSEHPVPA